MEEKKSKKGLIITIIIILVVIGGALATFFILNDKKDDEKSEKVSNKSTNTNTNDNIDEFADELNIIAKAAKSKYVEDMMVKSAVYDKCYDLDELSEYVSLSNSYEGSIKVTSSNNVYLKITDGTYSFDGQSSEIDIDNITKDKLDDFTCNIESSLPKDSKDKEEFVDIANVYTRAAATKFIEDSIVNPSLESCTEISDLLDYAYVNDNSFKGYIIINSDDERYIAITNGKYTYEGLSTDLNIDELTENSLYDTTCTDKTFENIFE